MCVEDRSVEVGSDGLPLIFESCMGETNIKNERNRRKQLTETHCEPEVEEDIHIDVEPNPRKRKLMVIEKRKETTSDKLIPKQVDATVS